MISFTTAQIAEQLKGEVMGDDSVELIGLASAENADEGELTFAEKASYFEAAEKSRASAVLVSGDFTSRSKVLIRVPDVRMAVARVLPLFFPPEPVNSGVHSSAVVDSSADVHDTAWIGPHCVIGKNVKIGAGCQLKGGNHIGNDAQLGEENVLHPNVVIYPKTKIGNRVVIHAGTAIGSDGYGYVFDQGEHRKMLQIGHVIIGDDVEIGANTSIDRGALGPTVIGKGTKIDNLVHFAHNVSMGNHCLVMGQVGIAGSTKFGDYCVLASQSGYAGHLKIGNQVTVGGKSGVMKDVPDGGTVLGIPAQPDRQTKRQWIALQQLPEMKKRLRDLERLAKDNT